ncbi:TIGR02678 family protein [Kitasatospora griseola]|uniref:TIGR02678 family protein n=1 Tax=Kitasatospora griseola TaxID=2064 RepID=UPI0036DE6B90
MTRWNGDDGHERLRVVRALLLRPLLNATGGHRQLVALARKHQTELRAWFDHHLGWSLYVERDRVRLFKTPADPGRPGLCAPTARQCALYCLALAALEETGRQTVISHLARRIAAYTAAHPALRRFDATTHGERRDLVTVVRLLSRDGVLTPTREAAQTTADEQSYVEGTGDALYDVDHRAAVLLLSLPTLPSQTTGPQRLPEAGAEPAHAPSEQTLRHALMRRLVDHPVVHLDELTADERAYCLGHRRELTEAVRYGLGARVEARGEGLAVIDDELTDRVFPAGSIASFAALVFADLLVREVRSGGSSASYVPRTRLRELAEEVCGHLLAVTEKFQSRPFTPDRVLETVVPLLAGFDLVAPATGEGIEVRPAIARYHAPPGGGVRRTSTRSMAFGLETADPTNETASDDTP